jgi:hypothetical protein
MHTPTVKETLAQAYIQNYPVYGLRPSSGIKEHNI